MKRFVLAIAASVAVSAAGLANAASVTFDRGVNDNVFALTAAQAKALGAPDAEFIGFLGLRDTGTEHIGIGDVFDKSSIDALITNEESVLKIVNGTNTNVLYATGGAFKPFQSGTLLANDNRLYRGVGLLFKGKQTFNFAGGNISTPNAAPMLFDGAIAPIPLPATAGLLLAGLGGLAFFGRRSRRKG